MKERILALVVLGISLGYPPSAFALIGTRGTNPASNSHWPEGAAAMANLPSRHSFWVGPPFGGGNFHFNYAAQKTADFQTALYTFAAIKAECLELVVYDGTATTPSELTRGKVDWEFEIWDSDQFERLNHSGTNIALSINPWFGRPLPAPRLTLYLGPKNPIDWSAVRIPANVTLLNRRVATSPYAASTGGVVYATIRDMANGKRLAGATLEVGHYSDRIFQVDFSATSGADGVTIVRDAPAGNYVLRVRREGYATRHIGHFNNFGRTLGVFDDATLSPAATLSGRVTNQAGDPIQGAVIGVLGLVGSDGTGYEQNLFNEQTQAQTDVEGKFALDSLPIGRVCLLVKKPGYENYYSRKVHNVPGEAGTIVILRSSQAAAEPKQ